MMQRFAIVAVLAGCGADVSSPVDASPAAPAPDVAEPDVAEPDVAEPDVAEPDVAEPDVVDAALPDGPPVDAAIPDANPVDAPTDAAVLPCQDGAPGIHFEVTIPNVAIGPVQFVVTYANGLTDEYVSYQGLPEPPWGGLLVFDYRYPDWAVSGPAQALIETRPEPGYFGETDFVADVTTCTTVAFTASAEGFRPRHP
jgi:hypothetical protein